MNRRELLKTFGLTLGGGMLEDAGVPRLQGDIDILPPVELTGEVKTIQGQPALVINGQVENPMFYALTDCPGGRWTREELPAESIANFVNLGFRLIQVDLFLWQMWDESGKLDIRLARRQLQGILRLRRDAAVFLRVHVNAPEWWKLRYPDELIAFSDRAVQQPRPAGLHRLIDYDLDASPQASLASERWRTDAGEALRRFCKELAAAPEGGCVAGIQVACGVLGEWHYWGFLGHEPDTGAAMTRHFRQWLRIRYGTDESLRKAWDNPNASIDAATVPSTAERASSSDGIFRDPVAQRNVIDYVQCQHETVAQDIVDFCRIVKQSWPRQIITGAFYGYFFSVFGREAAGGHLAPEIVLNSPFVDYLSGPQAYYASEFRDIGATGQSRGLLESCRLHGKLWLDEMDQEPHIDDRKSLADSGDAQMHSMADGIAVLRRNVAQILVHGMGLWFYDFGYSNQSGWWNDPELLREIGTMKRVFDTYARRPYTSASDVLVVYDTAVSLYLAQSQTTADTVSWTMMNRLTSQLYHCGAAFDQIYLSDIQFTDLRKYKAVLFANTPVLTPEQKQWIRTNLAVGGRHVVWIGMPGYCDGKRLSVDLVSDLTGLRLVRMAPKSPPVVRATIGSVKDVRLHAEAFFVPTKETAFAPLLAVSDTAAETFGTIEGETAAGLAKRRFAEHTAWFSSVPVDSADILREILRSAGCHIYSDAGDVLHISQPLLLIHTKSGGERVIRLPDGRSIAVRLDPRSTVLIDRATGARLLPASS